MSCLSIETCECIKRISLLLDKYQNYQDIIQPLAVQNGVNSPRKSTDDNIMNRNSISNDLNTVEYVEDIDNYNDDMMQYDDENIDGNEQDFNGEEQENDDDILTYLDKLNMTQILDDYNHIIIDHYTDDFESIYNLITSEYSHFYCDINECRQFLRNNRCRETENILIFKECSNNEYSPDDLVSIDLLDSIHCHLLHSFDIGYNIKSDDLYLINDENKKNELNHDDISREINFDKFREIVLNKKQRIIKIRGLDRIKRNKFKTKENLKYKQKTQRIITEEMKTESNDNDNDNDNDIDNDNDEKVENGHIVTKRIRSFSADDIEQNVYKFGFDTSSMIKMNIKYNNLKQEILNNNICKLDIRIYTHIIVKAQRKLSCDISRSLTSDEYGPLLVENIMVLIIYCNFDILRNKYFNILNDMEKLNELNELNEFYNFHNGLENTVRLYGISVSDAKSTFYLKKIKKFYHCCSSQIIFPGVKCQFFNIKSMSANIAPVALYNYDNNKNVENAGIILEFGPYHLYIKYFTCSWISCYGGEDERLFINNKGSLELQNISFINNGINNNDKQIDFRLFLEALSCFDGSLKEGWKSTSTTNQHYQIINRLIQKKNDNDIETYQERIFDEFCNNKLKIDILVQNLRGPFCKLLFKSDTNTSYLSASTQLIRFDFLCRLFPKCRIIKTWYVANPDYNQHSGINKEWINSLYLILDDMNKYKSISLLNKIIINNHHQKVEPIISYNEINQLFKDKFFEKGWKIYLNKYSNEMDEIIMSKIMIWNIIKINRFDIENGYYYISTDIVNHNIDIIMKYNEFRDLFEEINKKLSSEKNTKLKELKKIFPSKVLFKKQNNEKLMKQRKEKLNQYFEKLIKYANNKEINNDNQSNIKMIIMTTLTQYLIK